MSPSRWCLALVALAALACSGLAPDIHPAFEAAKTAAQADPGPAPAGFAPDAVATLSRETTESVLRAGIASSHALSSHWNGKIGNAKVDVAPDLRVDSISLGASTRCEGCLDVKIGLSGPIHITVGQQERAVEAKGSATVAALARAAPDGKGFALTALLKSISDVSLDVPGPAALLGDTIDKAVQRAVNQALDQARPIDLGHVGGGDVLRAVRVEAAGPGLAIAMATRAIGVHPLPPASAPPAHGVRLTVSADSLVALAAARAFDAVPDPKTHSIVPVPTSLSVNQQRFELGLRLWCLEGRGWWRDYTAHGTLSAGLHGISLIAGKVDEGAASKGAELADPAVALAHSVIPGEIQTELTRLLPVGSADSPLGTVSLRAVSGAGGAIEVDADVGAADR